jgi:hypothetical protein
MWRVPAVIIAAVIGGAGLTACAASSAPVASSTAASGTATSQAATAAATPTPALTPSPTPTNTQSAAAEPSVTATHSESSPHATPSPSPTSSATNTGSGTHNFTVPAIPGENVVSGWGSYTKIGTARVKVTMCAKQTGSAFSVGAIALAYDASGADQNIGATILTGPGNSTCVMTTFILYTVHLKVHAFIGGSNGTIVKTGPVPPLY